MKYLELAFAVLGIVAALQALAPRLPAWVPMPLLQVLAGVGLSTVAALDALPEQSSLLFAMLVPPLLYLEAWLAPKREFFRNLGPILGLALGLVGVTIATLAWGLHALLPTMAPAVCVALAAALAPTDATAVATATRQLPLPQRLRTLLNGESLLNDAVALVVFQFAVAAAVRGFPDLQAAARSLAVNAAGGVVLGVGVAWLGAWMRWHLTAGRASQVPLDTLVSLLTPYAAFLAAEELDVSGVLAVVAAGLCSGIVDRKHLGAESRLHGTAVWKTAELALNGAVFVLLGLQLRQVLHRVAGYSAWTLLLYVLLLVLALVLLRGGWIALGAAAARLRSLWTGTRTSALHAGAGELAVVGLSAARGSITLTAALAIPLTTADGAAMPGRNLAVILAAGTIAVTLLLQAALPVALRRHRSATAHPLAQPPAQGGHTTTDPPADACSAIRRLESHQAALRENLEADRRELQRLLTDDAIDEEAARDIERRIDWVEATLAVTSRKP